MSGPSARGKKPGQAPENQAKKLRTKESAKQATKSKTKAPVSQLDIKSTTNKDESSIVLPSLEARNQEDQEHADLVVAEPTAFQQHMNTIDEVISLLSKNHPAEQSSKSETEKKQKGLNKTPGNEKEDIIPANDNSLDLKPQKLQASSLPVAQADIFPSDFDYDFSERLERRGRAAFEIGPEDRDEGWVVLEEEGITGEADEEASGEVQTRQMGVGDPIPKKRGWFWPLW